MINEDENLNQTTEGMEYITPTTDNRFVVFNRFLLQRYSQYLDHLCLVRKIILFYRLN